MVNGVPTNATVSYDDFGATRAVGEKWHECALCAHVDVESAMRRVGGRFYCERFGCAEEKSI
jgi:hypothetical protein